MSSSRMNGDDTSRPSFLSSRGLRVDILTAFVGLLLATVVAIAGFTHNRNRQAILDLSDDLIRQAANISREKATAYLEPAAAMATRCAGVTGETLSSGGELSALEDYAVQMVATYPQFAMINFGDEHGNFLMPKKLPDGTIATKIIRRTANPPTVTWNYRDSAEHVVRSETSEIIDYDPRVRSWYVGAKQSRELHWTDTYIFFTDRRPGITASYPVLADDGTLLGVVGFDIELESLSHFLASLQIGANGLSFIVDGGGNVVAYPNLDSIVVEGADGLRTAHLEEVSAPWVAASLDEHNRTRQSSFSFARAGRRYVASYTPLLGTVRKKWKIAVVVPEDDFTAPLRAADRGVMLLSLLILAVAVIATTYLARRISRPIAQLSKATARIRSFDLTEDTPVSSPIREIQLMDDSISAMRTGLRSFQKYVPAALVRQLIETGEDARIGGQSRELTLMFSDVNDFTGRSEKLSPEELMVHLSEYLDELTRLLIQHGGTVDKYIGDGVMAFWGAPMDDVQQGSHACRAALACRSRMEELNRTWEAEGRVAFPTRWGIHTGPTVVGNVGSAERMNYSAVGDSVNLASRLEAVNKIFRTSVIVSESTLRSAGDGFIYRPLGTVTVKGKLESVDIYELQCEAADPQAARVRRLAELSGQGLRLYLDREWREAAEVFEAIMSEFPDDGPGAEYLRRCNQLAERSPGPDWDGVLRLDHK
jgi:adenylate cyclase